MPASLPACFLRTTCSEIVNMYIIYSGSTACTPVVPFFRLLCQFAPFGGSTTFTQSNLTQVCPEILITRFYRCSISVLLPISARPGKASELSWRRSGVSNQAYPNLQGHTEKESSDRISRKLYCAQNRRQIPIKDMAAVTSVITSNHQVTDVLCLLSTFPFARLRQTTYGRPLGSPWGIADGAPGF